MIPINKICTGCGVKQTKDAECWDYSQCSKCFNSMPMSQLVKAQQEVPMKIVPSIYILGPMTDKITTSLDQALFKVATETHFATPKEIEKFNQNMEWVVS